MKNGVMHGMEGGMHDAAILLRKLTGGGESVFAAYKLYLGSLCLFTRVRRH